MGNGFRPLPINWRGASNLASTTTMPFRDLEIDKLLTAARIARDPDEAGRARPGLERERTPDSDRTDGAPAEPPPSRTKWRRVRLDKRCRNS